MQSSGVGVELYTCIHICLQDTLQQSYSHFNRMFGTLIEADIAIETILK